MDNPEHRDIGMHFKVFLDGVELPRGCVMADEEEGIAECYISIEGRYALARKYSRELVSQSHPEAFVAKNGIWRERLRGRVELKRVDVA